MVSHDAAAELDELRRTRYRALVGMHRAVQAAAEASQAYDEAHKAIKAKLVESKAAVEDYRRWLA